MRNCRTNRPRSLPNIIVKYGESMLVTRKATTEDAAAITAIWRSSFPQDPPEMITSFLKLVPIEYGFLAEQDGQPVSMVYGLPAAVGGKPLQYIYSAATLPSHRGRGVFGKLLHYALKAAQDAGCVGSFLRPAEPSLADYYARFGYRPWTYCERVRGGARRAVPIAKQSPHAYAVQRQAWLPSGAVEWPSFLVEYAAQSGVYATPEAWALCETVGNVLLVKEWLGAGDPSSLCGALGLIEYEWVRPSEAGEVYTMLLPFTKEELPPPYIGPVFD